ncbi:MAG: hypothetical protein P4L56_29345 [Candidatus Sulfopaludibacter sp.]|nr:hypothetical protein [Candidatus Sulfopaludibacter sp.]
MIKRILATVALLCFSLSAGTVPSGKQYSVTFAKPVQVGSVKLAAGDYKLKVDGSTATFVNSHKKEFSAPVKVEPAAKKASATAVETKDDNGVSQVTAIDISGADFKFVF